MGQFGIGIVPSKLDLIVTWPVPTTHRKVQVFLRFANFYCRFILDYSRVAVGFTDLLKGGTNIKFKGVRFKMIQNAMDSFNELKRLFSCASMLVHYSSIRRILLECDASSYAVGAILS